MVAETKGSHGGKRAGAGAKKMEESQYRKNRCMRFSDAEWEQIQFLAAAAGLTTSEFIRRTLANGTAEKK